MDTFIKLFLIFLISSSFIFIIARTWAKKSLFQRRIQEFIPSSNHLEEDEVTAKENSINHVLISASKFFKNIQFSQKTEKLLLESGTKLRPEEFLVLRFLLVAAVGVLFFIFGSSWYINILAMIIGFLIPKFYLIRKRKKRLHLLSYQLIETLGMIANSMRAGFSFMQAIQLAGKEMPDPIGPEFEQLVREIGLGIPFEDAMRALTRRLPNKELMVVVQAILAQRKSGGNLAQLLETVEETIRGRIRILEELNTLTSQGKMSAWIITLLPLCLGLYLATVSSDYFRPMLEHPIGLTIMIMAVLSNIIGWLFIQKIIRIEV